MSGQVRSNQIPECLCQNCVLRKKLCRNAEEEAATRDGVKPMLASCQQVLIKSVAHLLGETMGYPMGLKFSVSAKEGNSNIYHRRTNTATDLHLKPLEITKFEMILSK